MTLGTNDCAQHTARVMGVSIPSGSEQAHTKQARRPATNRRHQSWDVVWVYFLEEDHVGGDCQVTKEVGWWWWGDGRFVFERTDLNFNI